MGLFSGILRGIAPILGGVFGGVPGAILGGSLGRMGGRGRQEDSGAAANQYLNQIPGMARQNYQPYIDQGRAAADVNNEQYKMMAQDPTSFVNKIMQSYQPSAGYQFAEDRLKRVASNNAAAGGFSGTQYDRGVQSEMINALLSGDMQKYLDSIRGTQNTGLSGNELTANRGFNATGNLTDTVGGALNQQGGLAYDSAESRNANNAARRNNTNNQFDTLGGILGYLNNGAGLAGNPGQNGGLPSSYLSQLFARNVTPDRSSQGQNTVPGSAFRSYLPNSRQ